MDALPDDRDKYLTVSILTQYLKYKFDNDPYLKCVYLTGEISNFRLRSKNQYFSLKDDKSKIDVMMFSNSFTKLKFKPENGMKVLVIGRVTIYPFSGNYQIIIEKMEPDGIGALYAAYEQLKQKLQNEGLFEKQKKKIPIFPKRIAVITSESGAVIHDIITTVHRRYPIAQIVLFPSKVQGEDAADNLVDQIKHVQRVGNFDVLIIGRGGGSLEDLWPFNEEKVARALYDLSIPVISSVGHETDTTLTDLVADQRAATPTAAAEYATPVLKNVLAQINDFRNRLLKSMQKNLDYYEQQVSRLINMPIMQNPQIIYEDLVKNLDTLKQNLVKIMIQYLKNSKRSYDFLINNLYYHSPKNKIDSNFDKLDNIIHILNKNIIFYLTKEKQLLNNCKKNLCLLDPMQILKRGYTYVTDDHDNILLNINDYNNLKKLKIYTKDAIIHVKVDYIQKRSDH